MIDAEQSYLQEAIDNIVIDLQRRYNTGAYPVVFGTYQVRRKGRVMCWCMSITLVPINTTCLQQTQCYLKDARQRMHTDMDRAARLGYHFAAKLVRACVRA